MKKSVLVSVLLLLSSGIARADQNNCPEINGRWVPQDREFISHLTFKSDYSERYSQKRITVVMQLQGGGEFDRITNYSNLTRFIVFGEENTFDIYMTLKCEVYAGNKVLRLNYRKYKSLDGGYEQPKNLVLEKSITIEKNNENSLSLKQDTVSKKTTKYHGERSFRFSESFILFPIK